jgi:hypothetical protein
VVAALGDDAFEPELAGMQKNRGAVAVHVLVVRDPGGGFGEQLFEPGLAFLERPRAPVLAVELPGWAGCDEPTLVLRRDFGWSRPYASEPPFGKVS